LRDLRDFHQLHCKERRETQRTGPHQERFGYLTRWTQWLWALLKLGVNEIFGFRDLDFALQI